MIPMPCALSSPDALATELKSHLLNKVVPFWTKFAIDPRGGINTCIRDDGEVVSRDKWLWSQWRAVWVFSELYNLIEPRSEWLEAARNICRFASRFGWDDSSQSWGLCLDGEGRVLRGSESIYTDAFAISGACALARCGDTQAIGLARRTANSVARRLAQPHDQIPHFPYPVPQGARVHGVPMIFSLAFWEIGQLLNDDDYRTLGLGLCNEVFGRFYRPDRDLILERIAFDGSELPPPLGTAVVPGHAIESMWFQIHIARDRGDITRIQECVRLIRRHLELGWDRHYGGLFLAVDADGGSEIGWNFADAKLWWPHTEALYSLVLAYEHCREAWCVEWFDRVWGYCLDHYPVPEAGEWRQRLSRRGEPLADVVALPVKDPFHLPRALIYSIVTLRRVATRPIAITANPPN